MYWDIDTVRLPVETHRNMRLCWSKSAVCNTFELSHCPWDQCLPAVACTALVTRHFKHQVARSTSILPWRKLCHTLATCSTCQRTAEYHCLTLATENAEINTTDFHKHPMAAFNMDWTSLLACKYGCTMVVKLCVMQPERKLLDGITHIQLTFADEGVDDLSTWKPGVQFPILHTANSTWWHCALC